MHKFELAPAIIPPIWSNSSEIIYSWARINVPHNEVILLEMAYKSLMMSIFTCPEKSEVIATKEARFLTEYHHWFANIQVWQKEIAEKIDALQPINTKGLNATIVSIDGPTIVAEVEWIQIVFTPWIDWILEANLRNPV